jgi:hypothetical protein
MVFSQGQANDCQEEVRGFVSDLEGCWAIEATTSREAKLADLVVLNTHGR